MNMGTEINNQATAPQNARPRDAKMINFFFVDRSMSFIHGLSVNRCFTLQMLHALKGGWSLDRREPSRIHYLGAKKPCPYKCYMPFKGGGISTDAKEIKSAARRGLAVLLLKLALDAPQSKKVVERSSERSTDARE